MCLSLILPSPWKTIKHVSTIDSTPILFIYVSFSFFLSFFRSFIQILLSTSNRFSVLINFICLDFFFSLCVFVFSPLSVRYFFIKILLLITQTPRKETYYAKTNCNYSMFSIQIDNKKQKVCLLLTVTYYLSFAR